MAKNLNNLDIEGTLSVSQNIQGGGALDLDGSVTSKRAVWSDNPSGVSKLGITFKDGYYTTWETSASSSGIQDHWSVFTTKTASGSTVRSVWLPIQSGTLLTEEKLSASAKRYLHSIYFKCSWTGHPALPVTGTIPDFKRAAVRTFYLSNSNSPITWNENTYVLTLPTDIEALFDKNIYMPASGFIDQKGIVEGPYSANSSLQNVLGIKMKKDIVWLVVPKTLTYKYTGAQSATVDLVNTEYVDLLQVGRKNLFTGGGYSYPPYPFTLTCEDTVIDILGL